MFTMVFGLFLVPLFFRNTGEEVEFGGFFNIYSKLDISRDKFAWRFLIAFYMLPILVVLLIVTFQARFELWELDAFLLLLSVSGVVNSASARLQAVFIERDKRVDIFMYYGILAYFLIYAIPPEVFARFLSVSPGVLRRSGGEYYLNVIISVAILFVVTVTSFVYFLLRQYNF
jgi:hypothetical protein